MSEPGAKLQRPPANPRAAMTEFEIRQLIFDIEAAVADQCRLQ